MNILSKIFGLTISVVISSLYGLPAKTQEPSPNFSRDVRPILSNKCFTCHGPDEATREGGFRLDMKESAFGEADSGEYPIVAGDLASSELYRRIMLVDDEQMPPTHADNQLDENEKSILERWIKDGAVWEDHWAYSSPDRPEPPNVSNDAWVNNSIDRFVLNKLENQNLRPKSRADKHTLVRRLYFDLIGLPPTPTQVEQFVSDRSEDAIEQLVDQLLDSPHFGEHMATTWLDAARFADTNGYQNDFKRTMWPWRDWVIRAFNDNMPFDQFTIEQIAGDLLVDPTLEQIIATGFNRNHRTNTEGGSINEEWLVENVVDRVETTSTVFLGLTMGCARCHDHKFDPISQREFYRFFAYFNNIAEKGVYTEQRGNVAPLIKVPNKKHKTQLATIDKEIAAAEAELELIKTSLVARQVEWENHLDKSWTVNVGQKHVVGMLSQSAETKPEFLKRLLESNRESDTNIEIVPSLTGQALKIAPGANQQVDLKDIFAFDGSKPFSCSVWIKPNDYGAIISRMDEANAYRGFDMLIMPTGQLNVHLIHDWPGNAIKITSKDRIPKNRWTHVAVCYDGLGKAKGLKLFFNNQAVEFDANADSLNGTTLTEHPTWLGLRAKTPPYSGLISDLQIYDTCLDATSVDHSFGSTLIHIIHQTRGERTEEQETDIQHLFLASAGDEFTKAQRKVDELLKRREKIENSAPTVMVMKELDQPRSTYVLSRGQYDQPDKDQPVQPGTPGFLPEPVADSPANRLGLAQWLVDPKNPLVARVAVNRIWQQLFGDGLVGTQEDFGVQSPLPLHPELLDWLAVEFVESGWDVKNLIRLIVSSATYQQTSHASAEEYIADPDNRWLARGARFRLPAESIRDNALAISGLLNREIGGPSIKPYQPEGVWSDLAGGAGEGPYVQETDDNLYRRSLYIYRKRTVPHPTMTTFDASSREICTVARGRTNTPLQALALLNDTTYVEAARSLAESVLKANDQRDPRIIDLFFRATARPPTEGELNILRESLERYRKRFANDPESADQLITLGFSPRDEKLDAVNLAAFTTLASVVLNLDETITRE